MIVKFGKQYLSELYYNGKCKEKKYRFQPNVVTNYKRRIDVLNDASGIEALYRINSLCYEVLQGDKKGYLLYVSIISTELSLKYQKPMITKRSLPFVL